MEAGKERLTRNTVRAATNRVERFEGDALFFRFDAPEDENMTPLEGISGPGDSGGLALIEAACDPRVAGLSGTFSGQPKGRYGKSSTVVFPGM